MDELRVDPEDGSAYTYREFKARYKDVLSKQEIREHWANCEPVHEDDHDEDQDQLVQDADQSGSMEQEQKRDSLLRMDPEDGSVYTYKEFKERYKAEVSKEEMREYWAKCESVPEDDEDHQDVHLQDELVPDDLPRLKVTIVSAEIEQDESKLEERFRLQGVELSCICGIKNKEHTETTTERFSGSLHPVWNHMYTISDYEQYDSLIFAIFESDRLIARGKLKPAKVSPMYDGSIELTCSAPGMKAVLEILLEFLGEEYEVAKTLYMEKRQKLEEEEGRLRQLEKRKAQEVHQQEQDALRKQQHEKQKREAAKQSWQREQIRKLEWQKQSRDAEKRKQAKEEERRQRAEEQRRMAEEAEQWLKKEDQIRQEGAAKVERQRAEEQRRQQALRDLERHAGAGQRVDDQASEVEDDRTAKEILKDYLADIDDDYVEMDEQQAHEVMRASKPDMQQKTLLLITVLSAKDLKSSDWLGKSDPFCSCEISNQPGSLFKTQVINNTNEPQWNYTCDIELASPEDLTFEVWDKDLTSNEIIGAAVLTTEQYFPQGFDGSLTLLSKQSAKKGQSAGTLFAKEKSPGTLLLRIQVEQEVKLKSQMEPKQWTEQMKLLKDDWPEVDVPETDESLKAGTVVRGPFKPEATLQLLHCAFTGDRAGVVKALRCSADPDGLRPIVPESDAKVDAIHAEMEGELVQLLLNWDASTPEDKCVTPLFLACQNGHADVVSVLCEAGAAKDKASWKGATPLFVAAQKGRVEAVRYLCTAGANQYKAAEDGGTPLFAAAQQGHAEILQILLESQSTRNRAIANDRAAALYVAAQEGHKEAVRTICVAGVNPNKAVAEGATPLSAASQGGHLPVVQYLCQSSADIHQAADNGTTPLALAARYGLVEVVQYLLSAGAEKDHQAHDGATPVFLACMMGHTDVVKVLLKAAADVEKATKDKTTPLSIASSNGHNLVVQYLCEAGVALDALAHSGGTALCAAALQGHEDVVQLLCEAKADNNLPCTQGGETPISMASQNGHLNVVFLLLQALAVVDTQKSDGVTPLILAAKNGHAKVTKLLCEAQAAVNTSAKNAATALVMASLKGHSEVIEALCQASADTEKVGQNDASPLFLASRAGHQDAVWALCRAGAKRDRATRQGVTPFSIAEHAGHHEVVQILTYAGVIVLVGSWKHSFGGLVTVRAKSEDASLMIEHPYLGIRTVAARDLMPSGDVGSSKDGSTSLELFGTSGSCSFAGDTVLWDNGVSWTRVHIQTISDEHARELHGTWLRGGPGLGGHVYISACPGDTHVIVDHPEGGKKSVPVHHFLPHGKREVHFGGRLGNLEKGGRYIHWKSGIKWIKVSSLADVGVVQKPW